MKVTFEETGVKTSAFVPRSIELRGGFRVERPIDMVFPLFSPLGEKLWVPGWEPELLHPPGATWERGQIFRTRERGGEVVWVITLLDPATHRVEYHRIEPSRYVARVSVECRVVGDAATDVRTSYAYVGLSDEGNAEIDGMSVASYDAKMLRWKEWIGAGDAGR